MNPNIHWIIPMLAGMSFSLGFLLIFIALINYMIDIYPDRAVSILAAVTCSRSVFGAALLFATHLMYRTLGIAWATSLLGFLATVLAILPFIFLKYGAALKRNGLGKVVLPDIREWEIETSDP